MFFTYSVSANNSKSNVDNRYKDMTGKRCSNLENILLPITKTI